MDTATICWDAETASIRYIDQTELPARFIVSSCSSVARLAEAIVRLEIRGAPALGAAGGYGVALAACRSDRNRDAFFEDVRSNANL
ncbi:MAG: S-methyl-5-thioribose-1-phosphate isomerase, partial [Methanomicrobiales archaeon]|nr:S-methyl-5-thioribose-1-phosphate isomerase [Methanomicrobiales archaeon]